MTGTTGGNQSHYQVIHHCLEAASRFAPGSNLHLPALQDLKELLPAVPVPSASADAGGTPATLSDAIALVAFAQSSTPFIVDRSTVFVLGPHLPNLNSNDSTAFSPL
jgi:hypothetical protein